MVFKNHYKKILVVIAALFVLFTPLMITTGGMAHISLASAQTVGTTGAGVGTNTQNASQTPSYFSCVSSPATCGVYYISLTVNGFLSLLLMLGAWLVQLGLQFNDNIFNSPAVQTGFSVSLAVANLGFVLGIIIIAIATIIRNQTYGIKQLLWKLVVMAILVNFGLVIAAPIVGFADNMSNYFIDATSPSSVTGGYSQYVLTLTGAFAPQSQLTPPTTGSGTWTSICQSWMSSPLLGAPSAALYGVCHATNTPTTNPADNFWQNTMAMLFDIVFSAITVFTFFALAILLIVRYLMLGGLLIILPLAWLTYIFPKFDNSFSKWWNTFVKWVFFPPLALFFIYLAFTTAVTTNTANGNAATQYTAAAVGGNSATPNTTNIQGMAAATGLNESLFAQAADEILLVGLMLMGLMFASSLAGKAGSVAVNAGKAGAGMVGGYVTRQTKKGARLAYQKSDKAVQNATGMGITQRLREGNVPLNFIPGVRRGAALAGSGIASVSTNEALVKEAQAKVPQSWEAAKSEMAGSRNTQDLFARIALGVKEGRIQRSDMVNGKRVDDFLDNEDLVKRYGQEKLVGDANKIFMGDKTTRDADRAMTAAAEQAKSAGKSDDEQVAAMETATVKVGKKVEDENGNIVFAAGTTQNASAVYEAAKREFFNKAAKTDAGKADVNSMFGPAAMKGAAAMAILEKNLKQIAEYAPQIVPNLVKGMKSPAIRTFSQEYNKTLNSLTDQYTRAGDQKRVEQFKDLKEKFEKTIRKSIFETADVEKGDGGGGGEKNQDKKS